ncbi:MAG: HAD-IA family hydrolase [Maricaulaceae bacterium]
MTAKLAIFDVDGTLVDSRAMISTAMKEAFTAHGYAAPDYNVTRKIVGLSLMEAIDKIAPPEANHDDIVALTEGYKTAFVALRGNEKIAEPLYDGAKALVLRLKSNGWKLGIATGKSRRGLDVMMTKHGFVDIFDTTYCADDGAGKPDPFMVEANLAELNVRPDRAVMIGDTSFDMIMAVRAGVMAYGVNWGFHTEEEIKAGGANLIVNDMFELGRALDGFAAMHEFLNPTW